MLTAQMKHLSPILAVTDVAASVRYYTEILGFEDGWVWGEPPDHGGVGKNETAFQFTRNLELAATAGGREFWVRVSSIESLFGQHTAAGAEIVWPLEAKPWGVREYAVRDNSGYVLRFAEPGTEREASQDLPECIRIEGRPPAWDEMEPLIHAVGWADFTNFAVMPDALKACTHGTVAIDCRNNSVVGCALLDGDGLTFFYIRDVMVHPDYQNQRVGTALLQSLTDWADTNVPEKALLALFTGERLHPFYAQFGFRGPATGLYGMTRRVHRADNNNEEKKEAQ